MTDLQTTFYIVGIVFMSLALVLTIVIAASVLVIKKKISALHDSIEAKLQTVTSFAGKGAAVVETLKKVSGVVKR